VEVLTRYLAKELGPRRITANVVAPGAIETDFSDGMVRDNPEINKRVAEMTALGRVGVPDDIGHERGAPIGRESLGERSENRSVRRHGTVKDMGLEFKPLRPDLSFLSVQLIATAEAHREHNRL
jgi:hypothetical protein